MVSLCLFPQDCEKHPPGKSEANFAFDFAGSVILWYEVAFIRPFRNLRCLCVLRFPAE